MVNRKVITFIQSEEKKGVPEGTIRIMLSANGWTDEDINEAYTSLKNDPTGKKARMEFFSGLLFLVIVGLGIWYSYHVGYFDFYIKSWPSI